MSTTFLFSGQGSQHYRMGADLYQHSCPFRQRLLALDRVAQHELGQSIAALLYDNAPSPGMPFESLLHTSAAIVMVELATAQLLAEAGCTPTCVVGASLGLFAAASVAGCVTGEAALYAAIGVARIVESTCPPGRMVAALAAPDQLARDSVLALHAEVAAHNAPQIAVLSFTDDRAAAVNTRLQALDITSQRLPVPRAFHARGIDAARNACLTFLATLNARPPRLPLLSCAHPAAPLTALTPAVLWDTLREPIRFMQAVAQLERTGPHRYVDAGPAGTLATLLRYNLPPASASTVDAPLATSARMPAMPTAPTPMAARQPAAAP